MNNINKTVVSNNRNLYARTTGAKAAGIAMSIIGFTAASILTMIIGTTGLVGLSSTFLSTAAIITSSFLLPFLIGSLVLGCYGFSKLGMINRFNKYLNCLSNKTYCEIKLLSDAVNKSPKFVSKDLLKMINKNWFRQGHIDDKGHTLMVSHDTYQQYRKTQQHWEIEQQLQLQLERSRQSLSPDVNAIIKEGNDYILKIRQLNEAIPGIEISEKLTQLELLNQKIFARIEQYPALISDLRKLMGYYLPMTIKLLEAYRELNTQSIQGPTIINSKQEIEDTLDTLIVAFEKILDSLFQDIAWDVSSDISVLNTILAQEGLTKNDF